MEPNGLNEGTSPEGLNGAGKGTWIFVTFMVQRKIQVYNQHLAPTLCQALCALFTRPSWWVKKADPGSEVPAAHLSGQDSTSENARLCLGLFITKGCTLQPDLSMSTSSWKSANTNWWRKCYKRSRHANF